MTRKKALSNPIVRTVIFTAVLASGYLFSYLPWKAMKADLQFSFYLSEEGAIHVFEIHLGKFLEFIIWSFILPVTGFWLYNGSEKFWNAHQPISTRKKSILTYLMYISLIMISAGNITHVYTNRMNSLSLPIYGSNPGTYAMIYFLDEFLSHSMFYIGLLLLIFLLMYLETRTKDSTLEFPSRKTGGILMLLMGVPAGLVFGYASVEGQGTVIVLTTGISMLASYFVKLYVDSGRG
ncbi:MAG: hypothetical protein ACTSUE_26225, partial [Promethearchaeota archaeon]